MVVSYVFMCHVFPRCLSTNACGTLSTTLTLPTTLFDVHHPDPIVNPGEDMSGGHFVYIYVDDCFDDCQLNG